MQGLTWKELITPEYIMTFLEGFLLLFLPSLGFGNALDGGGTIELARWPSSQMVAAGAGLGLLNGIRSLRNLRAPSPANGRDRRSSVTPTPPAGG